MHAVCSISTGKLNLGFVVDDEGVHLHVEDDFIRIRGKALLSIKRRFTVSEEARRVWKETISWLSTEIFPSLLHRLYIVAKDIDFDVELPQCIRTFGIKLLRFECEGNVKFGRPPHVRGNLLSVVHPILIRKPAEILDNLDLDVEIESGNTTCEYTQDDTKIVIGHEVMDLQIRGKALHADWYRRSMYDSKGHAKVTEGSADGEIPELLKQENKPSDEETIEVDRENSE